MTTDTMNVLDTIHSFYQSAEPTTRSVCESIIKTLEPLHCCHRCMLRYCGIAKCNDLSISTASSPPVCPCCLGILQQADSIASKVQEYYQTAGYSGVSQFNLSIRFPINLSMRHHSTHLFIRHTLQQDQLPTAIEVREALKNILHDSIAKATGLEYHPKAPFMFQFAYSHSETSQEYKWMTRVPEAEFKVKFARKKDGTEVAHGLSMESVAKAAKKLDYSFFNSQGQCPPVCPSTFSTVGEFEGLHQQIYIAGRYNKLQRHISNSPWFIQGQLKVPHSVEGLISCHLLDATGSSSSKFSSSGREDADVLMLGSGRPFYFEMVNPKHPDISQQQLSLVQDTINTKAEGKIKVQDLQVVSRDSIKVLKDSASTKQKSYSCLIWLSNPVTQDTLDALSTDQDIHLKQQNPTRVPRRADIVRDKIVHKLVLKDATNEMESEDAQLFIKENTLDPSTGMLIRADLKTSAGTYVKEFVHGDQGRTVPCLQSLLNVQQARVVALDVTQVYMDWPPRLN